MPRPYQTVNQIDQEFAALRFLAGGYGDRTERCLRLPKGEEPYLEMKIFNGGYTGDCYSGSRYFRVSWGLVEELRRGGYLKGTPQWGYTDHTEQHLNRRGEERLLFLRQHARPCAQLFGRDGMESAVLLGEEKKELLIGDGPKVDFIIPEIAGSEVLTAAKDNKWELSLIPRLRGELLHHHGAVDVAELRSWSGEHPQEDISDLLMGWLKIGKHEIRLFWKPVTP